MIDITLQQLIERREQLNNDIIKLIRDFENETGAMVKDISFESIEIELRTGKTYNQISKAMAFVII